MIKQQSLKKAFTLVELIIVIAIIAILAVTAFLLLTKWLSKARDSSRASNLANIEKSLQITMTDKTSLPKPDSYTLIYASGTSNVIGYQGYFGDGVKDAVGNINSAPKDGDDYFTYYLSADLNKYQLAGFLENTTAYNPNVVTAVDYSARFVTVKGDRLGLLTDTNKSPLQTLGLTGLDLLTGNTSYTAYLDNSNNVAGTGKSLISMLTMNSKNIIKFDTDLVFYSDMETTTTSGGYLVIKDFSNYGNNGVCFNGSGNNVNCGQNGGPLFVDGNKGKTMQFDGINDYIAIPNLPILISGTQNITIVATVVPTKFIADDFQAIIGDGWYKLLLAVNQGTKNFEFHTKDITNNIKSTGGYNFDKLNTVYKLIGVISGQGDRKIYVNGDLKKSANYGVNNFRTGARKMICIGSLCDDYSPNWDFFNGTIDEVRIYNRALSDDEVKALYTAN